MSFYSPIDRLAQTLPRPKGTGAEFMTELSKMPGYKSQEAEDRGLQALMNLPKMERAQFMEALKAKQPVVPETGVLQTPHHKEYTLPGGSNYREILLKHPQGEFKGVGHHFGGEPNILASVRAKDRLGPNGEKILHIEELQSDWHQRGREHGYKKSTGPADSTGWKVVYPYPHDPDEIAIVDKDGKEIWSGYNNYYTEKEAIDHVASYINEDEYADEHKVPDAPFKKNWHEMALKKMIHHAAKNGYDAIAITPGAEQAERYNMAQHVSDIRYDPYYKQLIATGRRGEAINKIAEPHELPNYVGKEVAEKLLQTPISQGTHKLSGLDLESGGEGMKGFYDKIVPNFLNQFGKKYGAKVGTKPLAIEGGIEPGWVTKPAAPREVPVHHFPITPAMREDVVKNGVPLYAEGGSAEYQGEHKPPSESYGAPLHDLTQVYPEDIYSNKALRYYGMGHPDHKKMDMESLFKAQMYRNKPDASVSVFRAVPEHVNEINPSDWVTLSPAYAKLHGESRLGGKYKTLKKMVKAKELWTAGDSIHEWGYHPQEKKAAGGSIKPVGYTKEQVTVSPNLDAMRYEMESVKHYTKKVK